ncbi:hypothetical protein OEZ85_013751 [Tetradesmus obliquus]|uniref:Pherophorin domain-containing protein n=1 Tax=Tetradesmus obliquus TaxID=3088 RepID=A0ABY8U6B5_TETOB|nr:hypothetical protein OEZ85_013751 [Tetradesmus obliquus]
MSKSSLLQGANSLAAYLPGGTYLSFTVLVQITAPIKSNCVGPDDTHADCTCSGKLCGSPGRSLTRRSDHAA